MMHDFQGYGLIAHFSIVAFTLTPQYHFTAARRQVGSAECEFIVQPIPIAAPSTSQFHHNTKSKLASTIVPSDTAAAGVSAPGPVVGKAEFTVDGLK